VAVCLLWTAHRALIFAIAQLSCSGSLQRSPECRPSADREESLSKVIHSTTRGHHIFVKTLSLEKVQRQATKIIRRLKKRESVLSAIAKMSARCTVRQCAHDLRLVRPFVPSSTDCWAVRAKIRKNGRLGGRRGETGSRNRPMVAIQTRSPAVARGGRPYCLINLILTLSPSLIDF